MRPTKRCPDCQLDHDGVIVPCPEHVRAYHRSMARLLAERGWDDLAAQHLALARQGGTIADADSPRRVLRGFGARRTA